MLPVRILLLALIALPFCGVAACAGDESDIRTRLEQWTASFNKRDKVAACDLFPDH